MTEAIRLDNVVKRFGARTALDDVSLALDAGACHGLIGPNGAGKSTVFSLCSGFLRPTKGSVRIFGVDPSDAAGVQGKLGVLPQDALFPASWTVGALVRYWSRLSTDTPGEAAARDVLAKVGLGGSWGDLARGLSHGMQKRLALAQALLGDPPLLLLDEPTEGLDPRSAAEVRALIRDLKPSRTLVISSHNLTELESLCDTAVLLESGRVKERGTMADLTQTAGLFKVQIARGSVPLAALRSSLWVRSVDLSPAGELTLTFDPKMITAEEAISQTLAVLLREQVAVGGVTRGTGLEARVLSPKSG